MIYGIGMRLNSILDGLDDKTIEKMDNEIKKLSITMADMSVRCLIFLCI
jgi:hypothetical protein